MLKYFFKYSLYYAKVNLKMLENKPKFEVIQTGYKVKPESGTNVVVSPCHALCKNQIKYEIH